MGKIIKNIIYEYRSLFSSLKKLKGQRKEYRIKPSIGFSCHRNLFNFSVLPTIVWEPWIYRHPGFHVIEIWWFNFHIGIGIWEVK